MELLNKLERAREKLAQRNIVCFTSDIDWASEYACEKTLEFFGKHQVPVTYFLTHKSEVMQRALDCGEIRAGIHPNFMPDSSQGNTYAEVVDFCMNLLPDARVFRAHRYYDGNDPMEVLTARGIVCESNVCTLMDVVPPFLHRSKTISFPIFWEDGAYLYNYDGFDYEAFHRQLMRPGLKVINIHPMHLMLNTPYFKYTREIKDSLTREQWNNLDAEVIQQMSYKGEGITTFIARMLEDIQAQNIEMLYLEDIYDWICGLDYNATDSQ